MQLPTARQGKLVIGICASAIWYFQNGSIQFLLDVKRKSTLKKDAPQVTKKLIAQSG